MERIGELNFNLYVPFSEKQEAMKKKKKNAKRDEAIILIIYSIHELIDDQEIKVYI